MDDLTFGEWLRARMEARRISQSALAKAIGISHSAVSGWLRLGLRPSASTCADLARVLQLPLAEVYRRAGYPVEGDAMQEERVAYEPIVFLPERLIAVGRELNSLDPETYQEWLEIGELYLRNRQRGR